MVNKLVVCSTNPVKVAAVKTIFNKQNIQALNCPSGVSDQPLGHHETLQGAKNRTYYALQQIPDAYLAVAFEAGVDIIDGQPYVIQWGVLTLQTGKSYTVQGISIELPKSFVAPLQRGTELAELIDQYSGQQDIRSKNGALGILTNDYITRQQVYEQMLNVILHYQHIELSY